MKNIILILLITIFVMPAVAQVDSAGMHKSTAKVVNKKGTPILPARGDIAVGIDMVPFLNYLGNFANQTTNNTYNGNFLDANTLFGKYFISNDMAVRGRLMLSNLNFSDKRYIQDDAAVYEDPASNDQVVDVRHVIEHDYVIGAGIEKRRGKGRLRGFFAAEINVMFGSDKTEYTYGNEFAELNPNPSTTNFFTGNYVAPDQRWIEDNNGGYFGIGAGGYLGVEFFIMPNVCLGSEVGWQLNYIKNSQTYTKSEVWDGNSVEEITELDSPGNMNFNYDLNNPSAALYLMFHF